MFFCRAVLVAAETDAKVQHGIFFMKRAGTLFSRITDYNNLRAAYLKALKGKRFSPEAVIFDFNPDEKLQAIKKQLEEKTFQIGTYSQFKIYDPKERLITAASFEDRIVHHAIMNVLESVFERQFIYHTYACRKNKGTHRAVSYAYGKSKSSRYFLKLDIRKYFDSINHRVLKQKLARIIKDPDCLNLLFEIIDSFGKDGRGLPIGNLASQFFANLYLSETDHFAVEKLKPAGYVRYMDDILIFADSRAEVNFFYRSLKSFTENNFFLEFKPPVINLCKTGIPFLGHLITPAGISLLGKNRRRKHKKEKQLMNLLSENKITPAQFSCRYAALFTGENFLLPTQLPTLSAAFPHWNNLLPLTQFLQIFCLFT